MRLAFCACDEKLARSMVVAKQGSDVHTNVWAQRVCAELLRTMDMDAHICAVSAMYGRKAALMAQLLREKCPQIAFEAPQGGMFLWAKLPQAVRVPEFVQACLEPVSYTHLDVYKRQQKGMTPEDFRKRHWMESEGKAGYLMYNNEIWALLAYLHLHFDDALSPESVARALGISTSYLHKMVKYNLMQSFSELLREIRVNYACGLLMNPALSVEQVAIEAGYNNSKTFIRAFQAEKGCTPGEFRGRAL